MKTTMLTQSHIDIIKSLAPLLETTGATLTDHFYGRLFAAHPELMDIFNMSHQQSGAQKLALFSIIAAYAKNIETPQVLRKDVERIAHKHTSFNVQPEMYQIVGHHLTETLRDLTGELFTAEVEEAWQAAYSFLAEMFIHREQQLYTSKLAEPGGWRNARTFIVQAIEQESELVKSFILVPEDNGPVISYQPGQYLGIKVKPPGYPHTEIRQYSLSDKPNGKCYRISVKRESGDIPGVVSNYLHDHVNKGDAIEVHPPAGDFYFLDRNTPVVLISAGVGATPMQAMLEHLAHIHYQHQVYYLHACETPAQHSFSQRTKTLISHNNWQSFTWYAQQSHADALQGMMNFDAVDVPYGLAHFYLCGPVGFMAFAKKQLLAQGVAQERIHYEVFGPHQDL
ncbi:NO-inducible flavohemoprotein [Planctobacterium marinum]|uniref:Flavohemoprotein n=1 Tax=Planctobacterium marinum TaxID=1631968 RepID=A0AA48HHL1_9ALTE|nr:flavohemoprotein [Planctobacterium marinum]